MHSPILHLFSFSRLASRLLPRRSLALLLMLTFAAFVATAPAQLSPPPDGGYPNQNTAEGDNALFSLTTGSDNTAVGFGVLSSNTAGRGNTATGFQALFNNTTGILNTALGFDALFSNTIASHNTAVGFNALFSNTTGGGNTASGSDALAANTTGGSNTATGAGALAHNTTGVNNTATGAGALVFDSTGTSNTGTGVEALRGANFSFYSGSNNTADGAEALLNITTGNNNTATGVSALQSNGSGNNNTANGVNVLFSNTTGSNNTAEGNNSLSRNTKGSGNTAIGDSALSNNVIGKNNIAVGLNAGNNVTGSNNIDIGNLGLANGEGNKIRIGQEGVQNATFIAGIYGSTFPGGVQVIANAKGRLGTVTSSARYKEAIKPMDKLSEAILALQPVTFRYKHELDPDGIPQFGLVAEQVEKVNPDLVVSGEDGKPYTVRYEAVNAMLLNEFLKEHRTVQDLKAAASKQQATIEHQQKQIEALTAAVRKVSERVELSASAPQIVANDD